MHSLWSETVGAECEVTLSLVAELRVAGDGGVQFTLPTVLNPRYQPASSSGSDDHLVSNVTPVATATKLYSIHVSADVCGALDIARVISHSDPINVVIEDDKKRAKISQDGGYRSDHEWSFVVHYNNPYSPQVLVETGDPTATGLMKDQVLMINMFPELPESSYSHFNEVIFVVDRSGSMNGEKIQSARAVLMLFLKSLPLGCRFNIVCFGSSHFFLFKEGSRVYTQETLAEACSLHDKMEADMGGTEILQPLKAIYSQPVDPEFSRQVLMLTDGEVWNVDEVTELAARYASSTRVFTVGIGEGASTALVKGLARAGRGRAELVSQRDRMSTKVMGLVASMLQSSVQGVSITCELDPPSRLSLVPPEPPVIFAGQHLVTFARIPPGTLLKKVTLKGKVDGQEWQSCVEAADVRSVHDATYALHRLAARASILHLCLHERDDAREEIVRLSVATDVLLPYTGFVAVDQDSKRSQRSMTGLHFIPTQPARTLRFSFSNALNAPGNSPNLFRGQGLSSVFPHSNYFPSICSYIPQIPGHGFGYGFGTNSNAQFNFYESSTSIDKQSMVQNSLFASSAGFGRFGSPASSDSQPGTQQNTYGSSTTTFDCQAIAQQNTFRSSLFGSQPSAQQNLFGSSSFGSQPIAQHNTTGSFAFGSQPSVQQNTTGSFTFGSQSSAQQNTTGSSAYGSQPSALQNTTGSSAFGSQKQSLFPINAQQNTTGSSAFGSQPSAQQNAFGSSSFGSQHSEQQNTTGSSAFGSQPSAQQNAFGPSLFGSQPSAQQNAFGSSSFGSQPSAQQNTTGSSAFGPQPSAQQNAFRSSSFGSQPSAQQNTTGSSAFGSQPSAQQNPTGLSAFGSQPSAQQNAFGSSLFGSQPSAQQNTTGSSAFGSQPSAQQNTTGSSAFGSQPSAQQNTTGSSAFGSQPSAQQNAFGSTLFGSQPSAQQNAFGSSSFGSQPRAQQNTTGSSAFGSQPSAQQNPTGSSAFGSQPSAQQNAFPFSSFGSQPSAQQNTTWSSAFGSQPSAQQNAFGFSLFGSQPSAQQNTTGSSAFGSQPSAQQNTTVSSAFGSQPSAQQTKHYWSAKHQSVPESSFRFGTQTTESQSLSPSSTIFGSRTSMEPVSTPSSLFGSHKSVDPALDALHRNKPHVVSGFSTSFVSEQNVPSSTLSGKPFDALLTQAQSASSSQKQDAMLRIIEFQSFDDSWSIADIVSLSIIDEKEMNALRSQEADITALATAVAVVVLQEQFFDMATEWTLVVKKAKNYLEKRVGGRNVEVLLDKIRSQFRVMKSIVIYEAQDSVVELSISSGVLSRHTALVAVDQDGKMVIRQDGPQQSPLLDEVMCFSLPSACMRSLPSPAVGCVLSDLKMETYSVDAFCCDEEDQTDGVNFPLFKSFDTSSSEEDNADVEEFETPDVFSQIIVHQNFDGSWEASDLAPVFKISVEDLLGKEKAEAASVFVTSVVVVLLREHFNDRALEWNLMVTKAINFLKMNSAQDLDKLLQAAKHHLGTLRAQHPSIKHVFEG
ncbi:von Willebrand factor type A [Trinorchestia longiramus]|nr:von Willebrand factor type A [Trinorchestia longiramus]